MTALRRLAARLAVLAVMWAPLAPLAPLAAPAVAEPGSGGQSGGTAGAGAVYVRVAPVVISMLNDGALGGKMSAAFMLEPHDAQAEADIAGAERQLHDAYIQAMHRLAQKEGRTGELTTIRQVKNQLKKATDRVLGEGRVDDVLIQAFVRSGPK